MGIKNLAAKLRGTMTKRPTENYFCTVVKSGELVASVARSGNNNALEGLFESGDVGDGFLAEDVEEELGGALEGDILHVVGVGEELLIFEAGDGTSDEGGMVTDVEFWEEGDAVHFFDDGESFVGIADDALYVELGNVVRVVLLKSMESTLSHIGHDDVVIDEIFVGDGLLGCKRVCVAHHCIYIKRYALLRFDALLFVGGVHGEGEVYAVVAEVLV